MAIGDLVWSMRTKTKNDKPLFFKNKSRVGGSEGIWGILGDPGGILGGSWGDPGEILGGSWEDPAGILGGSWVDPGGILDGSWGDPGGILGGFGRTWEDLVYVASGDRMSGS